MIVTEWACDPPPDVPSGFQLTHSIDGPRHRHLEELSDAEPAAGNTRKLPNQCLRPLPSIWCVLRDVSLMRRREVIRGRFFVALQRR